MNEHVYTQFLYSEGRPSEFLPSIAEDLHESFDGSFVGDVDPERVDSFAFDFGDSGVDLTVWISFESAADHEWFDRPRIELECSVAWLDDGEYVVDAPRCRTLVDAVRTIYLATESRPLLVYSCSIEQGFTEPPTEHAGAEGQRSYLTWLDVFTPAEVDAVGRERLLAAPAPRVEELDDGGVLVCSEHPLRQEGVHELADVATHLGIPHWLDEGSA